MWGRLSFAVLTSLAVGTSGILTYLGAMGVYRGIPFMQYVMAGLVLVYIFGIGYFWMLLHDFASVPGKSGRHRIIAYLLAAVVLVVVWFTSTYFNIISLSGMLVTASQIEQKLDRLDLELIAALDEERRRMENIDSRILSVAQAAQIQAENELELDGREREQSRGPMFSGYLTLGSQLARLSEAFEDHARDIGNILQEDTREAIEAFRDSISTVRFFEARQQLVGRETSKLRLAYSRRQLDGGSAQAGPAGGVKVPDFIKKLATPALASEEEGASKEEERTAAGSTENEQADDFVEELQKETSEFRRFLGLLLDTMRLENPVVMWEVRDRYQELLTQSVRDLMTETKSPQTHAPAIGTVIETASQHLEAARQRLTIHSGPDQLTPVLRLRTEQQFIPFLESMISGLQEVRDMVSEGKDKVSVAHEPAFYEKLRLEPIDVAVWQSEFRSIPLIGLAVLIDYLLIPILMLKNVTARAKAAGTARGP